MITVYGHPQTRSTRVTWLLEELGLDYQFVLVDFAKGGSYSEEFLRINPAGKVPAIVEGDLMMTESGAIVTYLSEKYSAGKLIPAPGTPERAVYEQWSYFVLCELEQGLWSLGKHRFALPKEQRVPGMLKTASWEFQKALKLFSLGLADKDYMLGDEFSAVDILLATTLSWAVAFNQPIELENVKAYHQRVIARPAFKAAEKCEQDAKGLNS